MTIMTILAKSARQLFFLTLSGCLFLAQPLMAADGGSLADGRWLAANLASPDLLLLDVSPRPLYARNHIPGAVNVDALAVASYGVHEMPLQEIERIYQALGVDTKRKIVLYDEGGTWFATRLFFSLHYHGFPASQLYILNGGLAKWQADGLPLTNSVTPAPKPGSFKITRIEEDERSRLPDLVTASGDGAHKVLLDALGPDYHYGGAGFLDRAGHIPHAVLLPGEDFFNADKTFKSHDEIKRMLAYLSIRPDQEIHAYCGGGGAASIPYFALKYLAGYSKVKLSVESQMGWLQDDRELPFWTYANPSMMRQTEWLKAWSGKVLRMYGIARVSVVDVRTPGAYAQGHLPFALNVPAGTFKELVNDPRKLAEILGASGVDASHEAVVVSGAGLTKESALAFVMLGKLGQKKVSVFMDSMDSVESLDKMARMGIATTKEATIVGAPGKPGDLAVPATTYVANDLPDGKLASANATSGAYPRVYIASGAKAPARVPDGKVLHIPYTELLNADGTPKSAMEIWTILAKAGVPRYAEIVCIADDPGEAAAGFFVLKLMGFPEVKVVLG